jgi:hypothetical protein
VLTNEVPDASTGTGGPRRAWSRRRRALLGTLAVVLLAFCAVTARLFIVPVQGMPGRVDAIVMMDGPGARLRTAEALAWAHRARFLVVSRGSPVYGQGTACAAPIPRVTVVCFNPAPPTTQGEAEFAAKLAQRYHWHSIALVTITPQDSRARLRMQRCFAGQVYVVTAPMPIYYWPYELAYEWGATIKALVVNRGC